MDYQKRKALRDQMMRGDIRRVHRILKGVKNPRRDWPYSYDSVQETIGKLRPDPPVWIAVERLLADRADCLSTILKNIEAERANQ